jgi:hypothetical protein
VISLAVVVVDEFGECPSKVALTQRYDPIEALVFDRADESSKRRESHPSALTEPYVRLSPHTASTIQPPASRRAATGQRAAGPVARCAPASGSRTIFATV